MPLLAATALLGGCAVYPDGAPAYGAGYGGGYGDSYGGYYGDGGPVVIQPSVSVGIGGYSGADYHEHRGGYDQGYRGQPQPHWDDRSPRPNYGSHNSPPQQHGAPANPSYSRGSGPSQGNPPPQASRSDGQHGSGYGNGRSTDYGNGRNH